MKIGTFLYDKLIAPKEKGEDTRNREVVLNVLLSGTLFILVLGFLLLVVKIIVQGDSYLSIRALLLAGIGLFIGTLYKLSRMGRYKIASYLLVGVYFLLSTALIIQWGIDIPSGILLYGLVIVLAGILLGSLYSLYAAVSVIATIIYVQLAAQSEFIHSDWSWTTSRPGISDALGFAFIYSTIALVSWLFNHQMERSLRRAAQAETALRRQKDLLETTVQERTQELQTVQLEKIQQMYRFAELGQLSTALLHDLANHLATLTLDIEGMEGQTRSQALSRAKRSIRYIDDMVVRVRDQLHGTSNVRTFNVASEVEKMVKVLRHRAQTARVTLKWQMPKDKKDLRGTGEPIRLRQLLANLISNGIDAYYEPTNADEKREVLITVGSKGNSVKLTVSDWGRGIPSQDKGKLFQPFFSTKATGMGMGLYIVKQIAEEHFLGSVTIDKAQKHTSFIVTIPKAGA